MAHESTDTGAGPKSLAPLPGGAVPPEGLRRPRRRPAARWLRRLLPALGGLLLVIVVLWPILNQEEPSFTLSFTDVPDYDGRLRMEVLRIEGTDAKKRPFVITAESASQNPAEATSVKLEAVTASATFTDGTWINMDAEGGLYRNAEKTLMLTGDVDLFTSRGYEVHTRTVLVDFSDSSATSQDPVRGQGPAGRFEAGGFTLDYKTNDLVLRDNVTMTIYPKAESTEG